MNNVMFDFQLKLFSKLALETQCTVPGTVQRFETSACMEDTVKLYTLHRPEITPESRADTSILGTLYL